MNTSPPAPSVVQVNPLGNANRKFGIWLFLSSELLIFCGLIVALLVLRSYAEKWPRFTGPTFWLVTANTFILLTSSLTVVLGLDAASRNDSRRLTLWIMLSALLGLAFIAGQAIEYFNLIVREGHGFMDGDPFGTAFFSLTGLHGLHVLAGSIWAGLVAWRGRQNAYGAGNIASVEMFGLYWHFVDLVWILIFTVVYLIG